jgi:hypothetical protein
MDLSSLSDDQLRALHGATQTQPDLSTLSDAQLLALHKAQPQERSAGAELGRQAVLAARYAVEGPMQLLNSVVGDPVNTAINYGIRGINALTPRSLSSLITGKHGIPELPMPSQVTSSLLDSTGVKPETDLEKVVGAVSKGASSGVPVLKGAQLASDGVKALPFIRSILARPGTELASQGVSAGASELTRQAGGNEITQAAAGMMAPLGVSAVRSGVGMAANAANELRRPITKAGAEQVAADTLGRLTQDRTAALQNLQHYNDIADLGAKHGVTTVGVPGSKPTAAAIAGDYGLTGAQQVVSRGDASPMFASRQAENNAARIADLSKLNATEKVVQQLKDKRDNITAPLRERAFANAKEVDLAPVEGQIFALKNSPSGAGDNAERALTWIEKRVQDFKSQGRLDAESVYELHKDIGLLVAGKVNDERGPVRLAAGLANSVKRTLADTIEASAPGFNKYLEHYSRLSKPIDRLQTITERLGGQDLSRVTTALPSVSGGGAQFTLSQHQMRNAIRDISADTNLAPRQRDVLQRVLGDLNAETFASRGGKMPGSDTYQNMASANFVNRVLGESLAGSGLGKAVQAPLNFVNRPFESRVNDIVQRAFQDPKLMEELLKKARTSRQTPTLTGLLNYSAPHAAGGLLGSLQ